MRRKPIIALAVFSVVVSACIENGSETVLLEDHIKKDTAVVPESEPEPEPDEPADDGNVVNNGSYFEISNAEYHTGTIPSALCGRLEDVLMNASALSGGMNIITVSSSTKYDSFYVGIEGVGGYYEYVPERAALENGLYTYTIPLEYSQNLNRDITVNISGRSSNCLTEVYSRKITFVESRKGALSIVLTFDNAKDLDLHLVTPSNQHVYWYNNASIYDYEKEEWVVTVSIDHDSNCGCRIDGLNNENIVIPQEFIEPGEYKVYVDLFSNCGVNVATRWMCAVRYNGELLENEAGSNPASGFFEAVYTGDSGADALKDPVIIFQVPGM